MPPLLDCAVAGRGWGRSRIRIRRRRGIGSGRGVAVIGVADADDSVIELFTAIGVLLDDTALVELEGSTAGIEGDGYRLPLEELLDLRDGIAWRVHVNGLRSIGNDFGHVVFTISFLSAGTGRVGVVFVLHDTMISDELPSGWKETTLAAPHTVVLTPVNLVLVVGGQGTIDKTLFRETHWSSVIFLGDCSFERGDCGERPARTAAALILGSVNVTICVVINGGSTINLELTCEATAATSSAAINPRSVFNDTSAVVFWASATEKLSVLLRLHVGSEVVTEDENVGVSIMCMLAIPVGDRRVVNMVTALLPLESARVGHVLVVLGAV